MAYELQPRSEGARAGQGGLPRHRTEGRQAAMIADVRGSTGDSPSRSSASVARTSTSERTASADHWGRANGRSEQPSPIFLRLLNQTKRNRSPRARGVAVPLRPLQS